MKLWGEEETWEEMAGRAGYMESGRGQEAHHSQRMGACPGHGSHLLRACMRNSRRLQSWKLYTHTEMGKKEQAKHADVQGIEEMAWKTEEDGDHCMTAF